MQWMFSLTHGPISLQNSCNPQARIYSDRLAGVLHGVVRGIDTAGKRVYREEGSKRETEKRARDITRIIHRKCASGASNAMCNPITPAVTLYLPMIYF